jgi:ribonuclease HI
MGLETMHKNILNMPTAYTDGAHSNKFERSGIGVFITWKKHRVHISECIGYQTNNVAELSAIRRALVALYKLRHHPLQIVSDSQYCIGVLTMGWNITTNHDLIEEIKYSLSRFKSIRFVHVRGHQGILGNEIADILASYATRPKARVVHCEKEPYDIYIGRGGKWGNPYEIGPDMTRGEAIEKFEDYLDRRPALLRQLAGLHGKVLGCHCAPKPCHGDVLVRRANEAYIQKITKKIKVTA